MKISIIGGVTIYTIGHSTRPAEEFTGLLKSFGVQLLADIRHFQGSRRYPHFNRQALERILEAAGIRYQHFEALGGRRKPLPDSPNRAWRVEGFRGYADYMETEPFEEAAAGLETAARRETTAYMCAEALWWSCHRALLSDYLKSRGWNVLHIMGAGKAEPHSYTKPARIVSGVLTYRQAGLFEE